MKVTGDSATVFVVDDDPSYRRWITSTLEVDGFVVELGIDDTRLCHYPSNNPPVVECQECTRGCYRNIIHKLDIAAGNTLEGVVGAWLVARFAVLPSANLRDSRRDEMSALIDGEASRSDERNHQPG